jgi:hypothetical protein
MPIAPTKKKIIERFCKLGRRGRRRSDHAEISPLRFGFYRAAAFRGRRIVPSILVSMNIPTSTAQIMSIGTGIRASYSPPEKPKHAGVKISAGS